MIDSCRSAFVEYGINLAVEHSKQGFGELISERVISF